MMYDRLKYAMIQFIVVIALLIGELFAASYVLSSTGDADRAVEIARRSRDRIENNGEMLKASSGKLFSEFAARTGELQRLIDTRKHLEEAGMLDKKDPLGRARLANINARIISEVGRLKGVCDRNLDELLISLDNFERAIADSIVDTQATRSINSNYELILKNYTQKEKSRFLEAAAGAEALLEEMRTVQDPVVKKRLLAKYSRIKKRLGQIRQRRLMYEARLKVAAMNQKVSGIVREKIRNQGHDLPTRFRAVMAGLYTSFSKVVPVAETGGTGYGSSLENLGFSGINDLSETLDIVEASTDKLNKVLDRMVEDVVGGLENIEIVDHAAVKSGAVSIEKEMEYLARERAAWERG